MNTTIVVATALAATISSGADATFHFMQIEQVIGGVNGDTSAQAVQLRMASASLRLATLAPLFGTKIPQAIHDSEDTPWIFEFNDASGAAFQWAVLKSRPDRTLGVVTCMLEHWEP